jgi:signal transduction histidine kinase
MNSAADSQQVFAAVARAATVLVEAATARVWIDDAPHNVLRAQTGYGIVPAFEASVTDHEVMAYGQGLVGRIFESRKPIYVEDVTEDSRWLNQRLAREGSLHAFAGWPLVAEDRVVGVLAVLWRERRGFTPEEHEILGLLADHAAIAIRNARLLEETERRRRAAETLGELGRAIAESLDVDEVGRRVVESMLALFHANSAALYQAEADGSARVLAWAGQARVHFDPGQVFPAGVGVIGRALATGEAAWSGDVLSDPDVVLLPDMRRRIENAGNRAVLAVPLRVKGRIIGGLSIAHEAPRPFAPHAVELLQTFADQAALALENARLYRDAQQALDRLSQAQARLVRSETLRAIGEVASGAAHHLNNLLAVVMARTQLLRLKLDSTDAGRPLEIIEHAARDAADVVRRIREFTRSRPRSQQERLDLNRLVEDVVALTRPRWWDEARRRGITVELDVALGNVPPVAGEAPALGEVLVNLVHNALDAMPAGGRLQLRTWGADDAAWCAVSDTGVGMSPEVQRRALEPFFTTKGPSSRGLGLSVNYGILNVHGGELTIDSEPGQGTTVMFSLPAAEALAPDGEPDAPPPAAAPGRRLRILVVDDDAAVRGALAEMLREDGHSVEEAADGRHGLARLDAGVASDVVITDLGMPEITGWDIVRAVKARALPVPVGLITGWGDDLDAKPADSPEPDFLLAKPFTQSSLRHALARAVAH